MKKQNGGLNGIDIPVENNNNNDNNRGCPLWCSYTPRERFICELV